MRASNSFRLAALTLAVAFAGGSLALAQDAKLTPVPANPAPEAAPGYGHYDYGISQYGDCGPGGCRHGRCGHGHCRHGNCGPGDCTYRDYPQTDLFHQYYIGNNCGGAPAHMYPAPNTGIPAWVGHVYYTYEPLYPHEFLYPHHRTYHRYYDCGRGLTRTHVSWHSSHAFSALKALTW